jgi:transposase
MRQRLQLREVTSEERKGVQGLAHARTAPLRAVERARVVLAALEGETIEEIAADLRLSRNTVYLWLHRFEERGLAGLEDRTRSGRPRTYPGEQVSEIVATALTDPKTLGLPFASWTLDRLVAYVAEYKGITMKRSRLDEVLLSEGLRWRKQENWFGERVDPEFAEKRGASNSSPLPHPPTASSSVSTRWVRKRQRASRERRSSM